MKKSRAIILLLACLAVIVGLAYTSYNVLINTVREEDEGISLGLDLSGGVSITYQAVGDATSEEMSDTVYKLQKRVEDYSTEAEVYLVGTDRIAVEIPGVTDAQEILEDLGTPGSLEFQTEDGEVFLTGDMISDAQAGTQEDSTTGATEYVVELTFTDEGAEIFAEYTEEYVGESLPIYLDDECISYPTVEEAITDGSAVITGIDSWEEAESLASLIRIGSLSVELEELQSEIVGAKLGEEAVKTSIIAAIIGVFIIIIFLIAMYRIPGLAASLALLIYCGILLKILQLYDVTLTLPGIAGIILGIGMAVDANIIIFSRIREEIANGRKTDKAIEEGFKKARSAILDGNITTLIAAVVLYLFGSGTVKGFAITLGIGIVLSMVTALFVTKWILTAFCAAGIRDTKFYGKAKEVKTIHFLQHKKKYFAASICVILVGFITMGVYGVNDQALNFSLEFVGGTSTTVEFEEEYTIDEIDSEIVPVVEEVASSVQTQKVDNSTSVIIKTNTLDSDERDELYDLLEENFSITDISYENISATISSEMRSDAIIAVIIAVICMLIYIRIRFKQMSFALSAIFALIHDVLIVLTFYAVTRISVGTTFIACMLTLLGYSINATIVIFDRVRENMTGKNKDLEEIADRSITQTLSRSINTTLTTFIMVFILCIVGVSSIRSFALPLMAGILCGAYSSVCLAGSMWYLIESKKK